MKLKSFIIIFLLAISIAHAAVAQNDSLLVNDLVNNIAASQFKQDGQFYTGSFASYRKCAGFPHNYQPDNNIFFTAITAFTLKRVSDELNEQNKTTVQQLIKNASAAYPHYQNKAGLPYYSFWPAGAPILPGSFFIRHFDGLLAQGEDADDSVMILMAAENNDSNNATLKKRLVATSNLAKRRINSTYKRYRNLPAYSTYLGEKMHPDFDFAVQCNILYFMLDKKLPLVKEDTATITLLAQMIKDRLYVKAPVYISPCYVKPAVLLYHISRLMGTFNIAALQPYKDQLVADAKMLLRKNNNIMEEIILRTSLLYLGAAAPPLPITSLADFNQTDQGEFAFFQARAAFAQPTPLKQILLRFDYLVYVFYCDAYNKTLLLEYLVLKNKRKEKQ